MSITGGALDAMCPAAARAGLGAIVDQAIALINELHNAQAQVRTAMNELITLINNLRSHQLNNVKDNPGLAISGNFDVKNNNPVSYAIDGTMYALAANTVCDTGTAATLPAGTWGACMVSATTSQTLIATWYTNSGAGYASESAALAAMGMPAANTVALGVVTVQAPASASWTAGTAALQGGIGGTPAQVTNYMNRDNPGMVSGAVSAPSPSALTTAKLNTLI